MKVLGLDKDPRENRFDILKAATSKTVKEFYEQTIKPKAKLLSIVGDSTKIDLAELEKIGPVIQIKSDQLFTR
jgi:hypothetical protein